MAKREERIRSVRWVMGYEQCEHLWKYTVLRLSGDYCYRCELCNRICKDRTLLEFLNMKNAQWHGLWQEILGTLKPETDLRTSGTMNLYRERRIQEDIDIP